MSNNETANREYKDALFKFIFGNENRKELTLSLFNAINDKNYDDPSAVQIVTLKDVLFINVHNDVAFILSDTLSLYEQQSTWNPNMPVRCLVYAAREYEAYINRNKINTYSTRRFKLPTPRFTCFYNGTKKHKALEILRLSDAYEGKGDLEATVSVYNLNVKQPKLKNCKALMEYGWFVNKVNEYKEKYANLKVAIDKALDEVPKDFILHDLLEKERSEVMSILQTEYSAEQHGEAKYQDGYAEGKEDGFIIGRVEGLEEGKTKGIEEGLKEGRELGAREAIISSIIRQAKKNYPIEMIADGANMSIAEVKDIIAQELKNN